MRAAHGIGDTWVQTQHQATTKGSLSRAGQWACFRHVATYTLTTALGVLLVAVLPLGTSISPAGFLLGQLVNAATHYVIDRRWTLVWLADKVHGRGHPDPFVRFGTPRPYLVFATKTSPLPVTAGAEPAKALEPVPLDAEHMGTGAYQLDQALHAMALFVAAVVTAVA